MLKYNEPHNLIVDPNKTNELGKYSVSKDKQHQTDMLNTFDLKVQNHRPNTNKTPPSANKDHSSANKQNTKNFKSLSSMFKRTGQGSAGNSLGKTNSRS